MTILAKLKEHLESNRADYETLTHPKAFTAQRVAEAQHVPGKDVAKVVMAKTDGRFVMAVLPATRRLDLERLGALLPEKSAQLAAEREFAPLFPGCEPGTMPPFGNLFGLPVYVDESLTRDERIVFEAGSYTDTVRMRYADFARLVHPTVAPLASTRAGS